MHLIFAEPLRVLHQDGILHDQPCHLEICFQLAIFPFAGATRNGSSLRPSALRRLGSETSLFLYLVVTCRPQFVEKVNGPG